MQESLRHDENQQATTFSKGFVSGLFLGEGSVGFNKSYTKGLVNLRVNPRIRISNTDKEIIDTLSAALTELGIPHYVEKAHKTVNYRQSWNICVIGWKRSLKFVLEFKDFTVGSKQKQLKMLEVLIQSRFSRSPKEPYTEAELLLIGEIKKLNKQKVESSETNEQNAVKGDDRVRLTGSMG